MSGVSRLPLAILVSGNGSNLQALLDSAARGDIDVEPRVVVSDRAEAHALERAARAGVAARVLEAPAVGGRAAYDDALVALLEPYAVELVTLAGFMRILGPRAVRAYAGRMLNIHPSLLPRHRGLHTHRRVLEAGEPVHGASVHFVTEELDGGPLVLQARVPVLPSDDEHTLSARVQRVEHRIYPLAVGWFASGRLELRDETPQLDGRPLAHPLILDEADLVGEKNA